MYYMYLKTDLHIINNSRKILFKEVYNGFPKNIKINKHTT